MCPRHVRAYDAMAIMLNAADKPSPLTFVVFVPMDGDVRVA